MGLKWWRDMGLHRVWYHDIWYMWYKIYHIYIYISYIYIYIIYIYICYDIIPYDTIWYGVSGHNDMIWDFPVTWYGMYTYICNHIYIYMTWDSDYYIIRMMIWDTGGHRRIRIKYFLTPCQHMSTMLSCCAHQGVLFWDLMKHSQPSSNKQCRHLLQTLFSQMLGLRQLLTVDDHGFLYKYCTAIHNEDISWHLCGGFLK